MLYYLEAICILQSSCENYLSDHRKTWQLDGGCHMRTTYLINSKTWQLDSGCHIVKTTYLISSKTSATQRWVLYCENYQSDQQQNLATRRWVSHCENLLNLFAVSLQVYNNIHKNCLKINTDLAIQP